jgi:hypothetical protein
MAYKVPPFLKRDGESLLFNNKEGELVFYVPEYYFTCNCASIEGDYVRILGIMDYAIFDKNGKHNGLKPFRFPTIFLCAPSEIVKVKDLKLTKNTETSDYRFLKFRYEDKVVVDVKVPQEIDNVELFYNLFTGGHIPTTIPYDEMHELFDESMKINGNDYKLSDQEFGIIVSEICRDAKDVSRPFRLAKDNNMLNYKCINIRQIPKYVSPYSAITSENWDEAVVSAVMNDKNAFIPQEKIIMS